MKINAGGATGGVTSGQVEHSDFPGYIEKTEQANGRVPYKTTSHMTGGAGPIAGERGIGDINKDMFGSMNGKAAGTTQ